MFISSQNIAHATTPKTCIIVWVKWVIYVEINAKYNIIEFGLSTHWLFMKMTSRDAFNVKIYICCI